MKIAISGTHGSGKSTVIAEFLLAHSEFAHEPEPYEALQEELGETFAANPSAQDFSLQLEHNVGRLRHYRIGDRVIHERSPADFIAYMFALAELDRDRDAARVLENSLALAENAIHRLDMIIFLPGRDPDSGAGNSEDPKLRRAVDRRLEQILIDDELGWFTSDRPTVVQASGTTAERLQTIEKAMRKH